ncbi:MAG: hypothetical protein CFE43_17490 [Burkholderiales bacterium PBB3]|nr:MAG: hypothetical protein CFE43_17490 [Burkholderiales bacterium PBB3]
MKHLIFILFLVPSLAWASKVLPEAIAGRWLPEADSRWFSKLYDASEVPAKIDAEVIRQAAIEGTREWLKQWPTPTCTNFSVGEPRVTPQRDSIVWVWCTVRKHEGRDSQGFSHIEDETTSYFVVMRREGTTWKFKRGYESRAKLMTSR